MNKYDIKTCSGTYHVFKKEFEELQKDGWEMCSDIDKRIGKNQDDWYECWMRKKSSLSYKKLDKLNNF